MTVTIYKSTDSSAPVLRGQGNSLVTVLDAILVNGYGSKASQGWADSFAHLVCSGTATGGSSTTLVDTATNFVTAGVAVGMQVFRTADGKSSRITSITTTTNPNDTLNFTAYSPVTPTFAALDAYTVDSSLRAYRQPVGSSNGFYMRVADNVHNQYARVRGYETMSDINTGTGPFPTDAQLSGGCYWHKSSSASAIAIPWICAGNGKIFYFFAATFNGTWISLCPGHFFGDFISYKTGDAYNTIIAMAFGTSYIGYLNDYDTHEIAYSSNFTTQGGHYIPRRADQTGTSMACGKFSDTHRDFGYGYLGSGAVPYPHPVSGGMSIAPVEINDYLSGASADQYERGRLPGFWNILHTYYTYYQHGDTFNGVGTLAGKTFEVIGAMVSTYNGAFCIETSDTWDD